MHEGSSHVYQVVFVVKYFGVSRINHILNVSGVVVHSVFSLDILRVLVEPPFFVVLLPFFFVQQHHVLLVNLIETFLHHSQLLLFKLLESIDLDELNIF